MACTYLFLDEAGDFNFSPSGTKHFVLSSIAMRRPFPVLSEIDHYKHDCLEYGLPTEYFHCSEDNPHVRGRIFDIIARRLTDIKVDSLVVEKRKTVPALRADEACDKIRQAGGNVTREAGPVKGGTTVIAFVQDPDGYKIELIERGV